MRRKGRCRLSALVICSALFRPLVGRLWLSAAILDLPRQLRSHPLSSEQPIALAPRTDGGTSQVTDQMHSRTLSVWSLVRASPWPTSSTLVHKARFLRPHSLPLSVPQPRLSSSAMSSLGFKQVSPVPPSLLSQSTDRHVGIAQVSYPLAILVRTLTPPLATPPKAAGVSPLSFCTRFQRFNARCSIPGPIEVTDEVLLSAVESPARILIAETRFSTPMPTRPCPTSPRTSFRSLEMPSG